eukprot:scaffold46041_cov36-Phaeocystis_antarctica.AAC.1
MEASMDISTSLSDAAGCEVFMKALTLDVATCTAAVSGDKYTFTLEYPLEPAVLVAAKTRVSHRSAVPPPFFWPMIFASDTSPSSPSSPPPPSPSPPPSQPTLPPSSTSPPRPS